jgi:hypothetical protein
VYDRSMGAHPPLADEWGHDPAPSDVMHPTSSGPRAGGRGVPDATAPRVYDGHPATTYRQPTRPATVLVGAGILGLTIGFFLALVVAPIIAGWLA